MRKLLVAIFFTLSITANTTAHASADVTIQTFKAPCVENAIRAQYLIRNSGTTVLHDVTVTETDAHHPTGQLQWPSYAQMIVGDLEIDYIIIDSNVPTATMKVISGGHVLASRTIPIKQGCK